MTNNQTSDTIQGILNYLSKKVTPLESRKVLEALGKKVSAPKTVEIVTSVELLPIEKERIVNFIKKKGYQEEDIEYKVDKRILGGIKIRLGDNLIDKSFLGILEKYYEYYC